MNGNAGWEPGEGWQMRQFEAEVPNGALAFREDDGSWTYWVREKPLPTEPWTMIEVTFSGGDVDRWFLDKRHNWRRTVDGDLASRTNITGFEVLAEPLESARRTDALAEIVEAHHATVERVRRETAKAVAEMLDARGISKWAGEVRSEFGVEE